MHAHAVNDIVGHVIELLHARFAEAEVTVEFCPAADLPTVRCDREQMVQVLLNLLTNALAVVAPGGHIRVTTAFHDATVSLDIEDDGPGVPRERREQIFEPFVSFRAGGIGLGLPIVREIAELHGGSITVEDSSLGGADFTILLPVTNP